MPWIEVHGWACRLDETPLATILIHEAHLQSMQSILEDKMYFERHVLRTEIHMHNHEYVVIEHLDDIRHQAHVS